MEEGDHGHRLPTKGIMVLAKKKNKEIINDIKRHVKDFSGDSCRYCLRYVR